MLVIAFTVWLPVAVTLQKGNGGTDLTQHRKRRGNNNLRAHVACNGMVRIVHSGSKRTKSQ